AGRRARRPPDPAATRLDPRRRNLPARAPRLAGAAAGRARFHPPAAAGAVAGSAAAAARRVAAAALAARPLRPRHARHRRRAAATARTRRRAPGPGGAARVLQPAGPRRPRRLAAQVPAGTAAGTAVLPAAAAVLALGLAQPGRCAEPGPGPGAGPALGPRIRAGARALPPDPRQPLAGVLARGGDALAGLSRRVRRPTHRWTRPGVGAGSAGWLGSVAPVHTEARKSCSSGPTTAGCSKCR